MPYAFNPMHERILQSLIESAGELGKAGADRGFGGIFGDLFGISPEYALKEREKGMLDQYAAAGSSYGIPRERAAQLSKQFIAQDMTASDSQPIFFASKDAIPKEFTLLKNAGEDFDSWTKLWGGNMGTLGTPGTPETTVTEHSIDGKFVDPETYKRKNAELMFQKMLESLPEVKQTQNTVPAIIPPPPMGQAPVLGQPTSQQSQPILTPADMAMLLQQLLSRNNVPARPQGFASGGLIQAPQLQQQGFNPVQYLQPQNDPLSVLKNLIQAERSYADGGAVIQGSQAPMQESQSPVRRDDQLAAVQTGEFIIPVDLSAALLKKFGGQENLMKTLAQLAAAKGYAPGGVVQLPKPQTEKEKHDLEVEQLIKDAWIKNSPTKKDYTQLAQYLKTDKAFEEKFIKNHPATILELTNDGLFGGTPAVNTDAWKRQNIKGWTPESEAAGKVKSMHSGVPFVEEPQKSNGGASISFDKNKQEVPISKVVVPDPELKTTTRTIPGTPGTDATSRVLPTVRRFAQNAQGQTILNPDFKDIPTQFAELEQKKASAALNRSEANLGPARLELAKQQLEQSKADTAVLWAKAQNQGMSPEEELKLLNLEGQIKERAGTFLKEVVTQAEKSLTTDPGNKSLQRIVLEARLAYMVAQYPALRNTMTGDAARAAVEGLAKQHFGFWDKSAAFNTLQKKEFDDMFAKAVGTAENLGAMGGQTQRGGMTEQTLDSSKNPK